MIRRLLCAVGRHAFDEPVIEQGALARLRCLFCPELSAGWKHEGEAGAHNRRPRLRFMRSKNRKRVAA